LIIFISILTNFMIARKIMSMYHCSLFSKVIQSGQYIMSETIRFDIEQAQKPPFVAQLQSNLRSRNTMAGFAEDLFRFLSRTRHHISAYKIHSFSGVLWSETSGTIVSSEHDIIILLKSCFFSKISLCIATLT